MKIFIKENALENVICNIVAIRSDRVLDLEFSV